MEFEKVDVLVPTSKFEFGHISDNPMISIVVPSLNQGKFIEETIQSVLNQEYSEVELVVIDGGSQDQTIDILKKYDRDPRVQWISEADNGLNYAYNKGMARARGEIIGLQPSSDTYEQGAFLGAVTEFCHDSNLGMVGGFIGIIDEDSNVISDPSGPYLCKNYIGLDDIAKLHLQTGLQSTFFKRDLALSIGGTDEDLQTNHTYFFLHYMLELTRLGGYALSLPVHWGNFRVHRASYSTDWNKQGLNNALELRVACERYSRKYRDLLNQEQVRSLLTLGYWAELSVRVVRRNQFILVVVPFLKWIKNGGLRTVDNRELAIKAFRYLKLACWSKLSGN